MPVFEKGGQVSLFNMLGGYGPSRAVNPSDGSDPVSLGLMPGASGAPVSREIGTLSGAGVPASLFDEPDRPVPLAQERPMAPVTPVERMQPQPPPPTANMLLLDNGRVSLNGRIFMLPTEVYENVLEAIIAAYEDDLRAELDFYRSRMQPLMRSRTPVRKAGRKAAVVRRVQGKNAAKKPARPRQARTKDMQPVPPPPLQE